MDAEDLASPATAFITESTFVSAATSVGGLPLTATRSAYLQGRQPRLHAQRELASIVGTKEVPCTSNWR